MVCRNVIAVNFNSVQHQVISEGKDVVGILAMVDLIE